MDAMKKDADPQETREWLDALHGVLAVEGPDRAHYLIEQLIDAARQRGAYLPFSANTHYINTIPTDAQVRIPGDQNIEHRIRSFVRWNAMAMVLRANKHTNVGGHIASFASAATLYDVGFNHFWRAASDNHGGDLMFVQGHSATGVYARAFMLGRLTEAQLDNYRQEVDGTGISSYPHPWLMPDFWQFPTVSMGLGPLMAIYQARFMRYLQNRGILETDGRKVWAFMGDGEMDEPESMGAISMASRENLDNLIFVVNCNLQRLDGPVRGNGKIIQELESEFRGAGWNVIKLVWGTHWDALLARDKKGILMKRMMECVDGEYQTFKSKNGAYVREYFFNTPELKELVAGLVRRGDLALEPRRPRPAQDLRGVPHGGEPQGPADGDPRQDDQGLRHGRVGRGAEHHAPAEEDVHGFAADLPRPLRHPGLRRQARGSAVRELCRGLARAAVHARAADGTRRLPAAAAAQGHAADHSRAHGIRALPEEHRRPRDLDDDGVRADPAAARARQEHRQAHRADRARRIAHVRHGRHVPAAGHLEPAGPALHAAGPRPAHVLQGRQARADPAGGHQRGRRHVRLDRRGDLVLHARRADDPVLHLLFDVRLPARGRPLLGGRRHALARLPAGRHRGPHDAERRRPAARGRPFAPHVGDGAQLHLVRPDVRVRSGGDHPGRPAPDVLGAGGHLLLPDADERELHAPGDARGCGARASSRGCTSCATATSPKASRRACS